ncbi:hypothetical protein WJX72_003647 [[Myrmecia] bisecta]|uniref:V-type proton ATPase subunit H n=1 Tax=[Myrmecia] bisecta TaxID=41462 RepID=A0AAW1PPS6_9CHLO
MASYAEGEPTTASILTRDIPWETFVVARLVSDRDLQLIRRYDKRPAETQTTLLDENGAAFTEAFLTVLRNVTREETVQYVLALLDQMLEADPSRAKLFHQQSDAHLASLPDPYTIFLRLLQRTDWYTQETACRLLTAIIDARPDKEQIIMNGGAPGASTSAAPILVAASEGVEQTVVTFVDWLCSQLRRPSHPSRSVPAALSALARLMKERSVRALFHRAGGVQLLAPLLRQSAAAGPATSPQLLYEAGLCAWQLSYYPPAAEVMATAGLVPGLVELARSANKRKVVRVAVMALRNLLASHAADVAPEMVELGLQKVVAARISQGGWEDEDIVATLEWLEEKLADNIQLLSTFEKYQKEVLSGSLDWTPMHTSEQFWRENIDKFEDKDFQILRVLLKLLEASREVRTLAVGCHDLGNFIAYHPHGRQIVGDLRGKELVMRLMMHPEPEVQKQALLTVQKIMLPKDKLEFLNAG